MAKKPKYEVSIRPGKVTPLVVIQAVAGSKGIISRVLRELKITRTHFLKILKNKEGSLWDRVREQWEDEVNAGIDLAEETIMEMMVQRRDLNTAASTAKWFLEKRRKEVYGKIVTIEGGTSPIQVTTKAIPVETLGLSLEQKQALLKAFQDSSNDVQELSEVVVSKDNEKP